MTYSDRSDRLFEFTWVKAVPPTTWVAKGGFELEKQWTRTVGWVLQQDREYMVVAQDYDPTTNLYLQVEAIPRATIVTTREIPEDVTEST